MDNDLGLFKDYGHYILSSCLILYGLLFSFLSREYGDIWTILIFINSLVFVAFVSLVLLFSSREIIRSYYPSAQKTPEYTSQQSYDKTNDGSIK